ncbi:hypothetical protein FIBSPDRAFT_946000 [Athelia psychrophila]|uniref:Cytochrome b561 domain-containing protein n=1 Tax=Athelia psychrophila TaxID=1759441 RepID=A0A166T752_9AGAM|nr:hypothetical protein FIBSPDRAFT_946000 [Fibularhizoctonia sp. CBS 109695]
MGSWSGEEPGEDKEQDERSGEGKGDEKRHNRCRHTVLNAGETASRLKAAAQRRVSRRLLFPRALVQQTYSQPELLARTLDTEEGSILERRAASSAVRDCAAFTRGASALARVWGKPCSLPRILSPRWKSRHGRRLWLTYSVRTSPGPTGKCVTGKLGHTPDTNLPRDWPPRAISRSADGCALCKCACADESNDDAGMDLGDVATDTGKGMAVGMEAEQGAMDVAYNTGFALRRIMELLIPSDPNRPSSRLYTVSSISPNPFAQPIIWALASALPSSASPDAKLMQHVDSGTCTPRLDPPHLHDPHDDQRRRPRAQTLNEDRRPRYPRHRRHRRAPPLGVLIAQWTRTFTTHRFARHAVVQVMLSGPIIVAGIALGINAVDESKATRLDDVHKTFGIALFMLHVVHYWAAPSSISANPRPPPAGPRRSYAHAVLGLLIMHHRPRLLASKGGAMDRDGAAKAGKQQIESGCLRGGSAAGIVHPSPEMRERRGSTGSA